MKLDKEKLSRNLYLTPQPTWAGSADSYNKMEVDSVLNHYPNILFTGNIEKYENQFKLLSIKYIQKGYLVSKQLNINGEIQNFNNRMIKAAMSDLLYIFNDDDNLDPLILDEIICAKKHDAIIKFNRIMNLLLTDFSEDEQSIIKSFMSKYDKIKISREYNDYITIYNDDKILCTLYDKDGYKCVKKYFEYKILR